MAYIDLTKIIDIHAQNIITEDSALAALAPVESLKLKLRTYR